jgi:hypothetical protein
VAADASSQPKRSLSFSAVFGGGNHFWPAFAVDCRNTGLSLQAVTSGSIPYGEASNDKKYMLVRKYIKCYNTDKYKISVKPFGLRRNTRRLFLLTFISETPC